MSYYDCMVVRCVPLGQYSGVPNSTWTDSESRTFIASVLVRIHTFVVCTRTHVLVLPANTTDSDVFGHGLRG